MELLLNKDFSALSINDYREHDEIYDEIISQIANSRNDTSLEPL